jgi:hypothetical protein
LALRVSGFGLLLRVWVSGFALRVWGFLVAWFLCFRFLLWRPAFGVSHLVRFSGFRVSGLALRVWGF